MYRPTKLYISIAFESNTQTSFTYTYPYRQKFSTPKGLYPLCAWDEVMNEYFFPTIHPQKALENYL